MQRKELLFFWGLIFTVVPQRILAYVHACNASSDPSVLGECVKQAAQRAITLAGHNTLQAFPGLDLPALDHLNTTRPINVTQPRGLSLFLDNVTHYGTENLTFVSVRVDPKAWRFEWKTSIPRYRVSGDYHLVGRLRMMHVNAKGRCNITIGNLRTEWALQAKPTRRENRTFLDLVSYNATVAMGQATVNLTNVFASNPKLSDAVNKVLNRNYRLLLRETAPALGRALGELHASVLRRVLAHLPLDYMFTGLI